MTVCEHITKLVKAENYLEERLKVSDEFIDMVRTCMPSHYDYIKDKEEAYQEIVKLLGGSQWD